MFTILMKRKNFGEIVRKRNSVYDAVKKMKSELSNEEY
jgi:hypothetical protein